MSRSRLRADGRGGGGERTRRRCWMQPCGGVGEEVVVPPSAGGVHRSAAFEVRARGSEQLRSRAPLDQRSFRGSGGVGGRLGGAFGGAAHRAGRSNCSRRRPHNYWRSPGVGTANLGGGVARWRSLCGGGRRARRRRAWRKGNGRGTGEVSGDSGKIVSPGQHMGLSGPSWTWVWTLDPDRIAGFAG